jgi:hypothetical protein
MAAVGQTRLTDKLPTLAACPLRSESDHRRSKCDPSLSANSGREQVQQRACLGINYSITSSAVASRVAGMIRLSALAVLRLMLIV